MGQSRIDTGGAPPPRATPGPGRVGRPALAGRISRVAAILLVNAVVLVVLLLVVEGLSGVVLAVRAEHIRPDPGAAEKRHTTHDDLLGWVNLPNVSVPDLYGPGLSLRTNGQGFRNDEDFTVDVPPGRVRLICSGDSFTLGYGVGNADTWCERLRREEPRLQTVNMGQGGYGIGQVYLWYARDGVRLDHQVQVLAVITDDFRRALHRRFAGYPKPLLRADGAGGISVSNVPVPRPGFRWPIRWLRHSRTMELLDKVVRRARGAASEREVRSLVSAVVRELKRLNESKGSTLVIVYLPTLYDYGGTSSDRWRSFLAREAAEIGVAFVDLVTDLRELPPMEVHGLFIQPGILDHVGGTGHYTVSGNAFMARRLAMRLRSLLAASGLGPASPGLPVGVAPEDGAGQGPSQRR